MIVKDYNKKYNGLIDILKFIFSGLIVFSHGIFLANDGEKLIFGYGLIGVEFFFVVSGYLLMNTIYSNRPSLKEYIIKRLKGLYAYFIVSFIFCFFSWLFLLIYNDHPEKWVLFTYILKAPFELFFMSSSGISTAGINGTWWYISAMLFAEWLLYPVIRYKEKLYLYYLAPLSLFLISGYMSYNFGVIATGTFSGFVKTDNLRAILGIITGSLVFYFVEKLKKLRIKKIVLSVCNVVAIIGYTAIFIIAYHNTYTVHNYVDGNLGFVTLPILFISVSITCLNDFAKGKILCKWLGKLSACIYFVHWQCMTIVQTLYKNKRGTYHEKLIFLFVLSFVIANIVMMISDYVRTKIDKYKYQILNILTDR